MTGVPPTPSGTSAASSSGLPAAANSSTSTPQRCANKCGQPASKLECPKCQAREERAEKRVGRRLGISGQFFCGQKCFAANYPKHVKAMHKPPPKVEVKYDYPEGAKDAFDRLYEYTGNLRAVMPLEEVPKREVPEHIPRPDYANNVQGRSFSEEIAMLNERQGRVLNAEEIESMRKVCKLGREVLDIAGAAIKPGMTTLDIDRIVHEETIKRDAYPSPLGYRLFPRSVCTSVNEVICHGIPDARPLEDGDIINLDVSLYYGGFHSDLNATYPVGPSVSQQNLDLIACSRECLDEAIRICKPGTQFQDVGRVIEEVATARGFSTNKTFVGHGVNQLFHAPAPNVPHYAGSRASGTMRVGQTFTIEPMICVGSARDTHWPDNWTAVTRDGKASAQFEETLLITPTGVEVLTAAPGWTLPEKKLVATQNGGQAKKAKR